METKWLDANGSQCALQAGGGRSSGYSSRIEGAFFLFFLFVGSRFSDLVSLVPHLNPDDV